MRALKTVPLWMLCCDVLCRDAFAFRQRLRFSGCALLHAYASQTSALGQPRVRPAREV